MFNFIRVHHSQKWWITTYTLVKALVSRIHDEPDAAIKPLHRLNIRAMTKGWLLWSQLRHELGYNKPENHMIPMMIMTQEL